jgi:hypothetical protein
VIRDLVQVRPAAGELTDRELRRFSRLWRDHHEGPPTFYLKASERRRRKASLADHRRRAAEGPPR